MDRHFATVLLGHPGIRVLFGPQRATDGYAPTTDDGGQDNGSVQRLLLNYQETGHALGISTSKVKQLVGTGQLRTVAIGASKRVPVSEVEEFVVRQLEAEAS